MNLDFLASATLEDVAEVKTAVRKGGQKKERNPTGLAIRLFRDGSVYPSQELVDKFALEYAGKDVEHGYGFDVIDSNLFKQFNTTQRILLISPVKKNAGKVDLFAATTYDENGAPLSSVLTQGAKTFGKDDLIPSVEEIYGITFFKPAVEAKAATEKSAAVEARDEVEGVEFVDLQLVANPATGEPWTTAKDVTYVPKKVTRGPAKGEVKTERREKPQLYAFLPVSSIEQPAEEMAEDAEGLGLTNEADNVRAERELVAEEAMA